MRIPPRRIRTAIVGVSIVAVGASSVVAITTRDSDKRDVVANPFSRPPTPSDRLPAWKPIRDEFVATRRIAVYARNDRVASLYAARTRSRRLCLILVAGQAAGGSCGYRSYRPDVPVVTVTYGLNYSAGVARNDVRRLVVIGTRGGRHRIPVSPDGGFIYRCPAYSGCRVSVASFEAYDADGRSVGGYALPGTS